MSRPFRIEALGFPWQTIDPFLFCVHHLDEYPPGASNMGPKADLSGRRLGSDFSGKDGWSMYHGRTVPGFPRHPHRGFETITITRKGRIDHSDSLGAAARFGDGDVQWMTAGKGIVHSEMFPLLNQHQGLTNDFFQIWLNLPKVSKMVDPHFKMLWAESIPEAEIQPGLTLRCIAGSVPLLSVPPSPPPNSWASNPNSDLAIWIIDLKANSTWSFPAVPDGVHRSLYAVNGQGIQLNGHSLPKSHGAFVLDGRQLTVVSGFESASLLYLQGRPIGEPVVQYGPFVMNSKAEIIQAYEDYQKTAFGTWPWNRDDPVHDPQQGRFAMHADGRMDLPT